MGQFWSKLDAPSTSNMEKFSSHQTRRPQLRKTSYVKKILNRGKVTKKRPTISSPHQANPIYLNGHKWRHVIITMPSKDQPPLPPQRQKRKTKLSTCLVERTSCKMMPLPVQGNVKFESHVKFFQTFIMMGLATYLPTLRRANLQSNHLAYGTKDNSCSKSTHYFQSEDSMVIEELFWHPIAASHRTKKLADHKCWSQPRFTVIRRKRRNQREAVSAMTNNETINQPQPVPTRTEFWQKFKQRMRPDGKRIRVGPTMRSLAKKAYQLCYLLKHKSLNSQNNMDNETNTNSIVDFYSSMAPFDLITSQHFEPAEDSDGSISDSLSEFSCSL